MLRAGAFKEFKGATTLLLWGDKTGMQSLLGGLSALRKRYTNELELEGNNGKLAISRLVRGSGKSHLTRKDGSLLWRCSTDILELAEDLVRPLLAQPGHQFLEVDGLAEQIIISRDEYPPDLH
jgi:hypothetical protein